LLLLVKFGLNTNQKNYPRNVLVTINGEALYTSDFATVIDNYRLKGSQATNHFDQILSDLVNEKLILQEARRRKIDASSEEYRSKTDTS